ncbi:lipid A 4'-phosphatase [Sulfuritortus calidifontis]|uniref:Lipid A 4'-phosphatase n=1 Tax=Sulfuritortus calidifontis TaxID=1914471 RepID=A0A4R3JWS2_9PROT|nr:phosphatase PAP2 family protein [Sulfuritortus calidifontis]TCS72669.1 lipid A 4'-phosphatase [Sulfuritortus calidifontis]
MNRPLLYYSFVGFGLLFLLAPELDLWASGLFYRVGEGFFLNPWLDPIHKAVPLLSQIIVGSLLAALIVASLVSAAWSLRKGLIYLLLVAALGPGLLVNTVFKDNWGRARPVQVENFGGDKAFTPAWVPARQCARNCAFVCGDASVGFFLLAPGFLLARQRRAWLAVGLIAGGLLGLMRLAQGGHFLSDVIFAFYLVYFSAWLLHRWFYAGAISRMEDAP